MTIPLETAANATFNALGVASVSVGPGRANLHWKVTRLVTSTTSTAVVQPQLRVYRNVETPSTLVDSTYSGNSATSETNLDVRVGERLLFVWSGGTTDAIATIVISGEVIAQ